MEKTEEVVKVEDKFCPFNGIECIHAEHKGDIFKCRDDDMKCW